MSLRDTGSERDKRGAACLGCRDGKSRRTKVLHPVGKSYSIRAWMAIGMIVALSPLLLSAMTGYLILDREAIPLLKKTDRKSVV